MLGQGHLVEPSYLSVPKELVDELQKPAGVSTGREPIPECVLAGSPWEPLSAAQRGKRTSTSMGLEEVRMASCHTRILAKARASSDDSSRGTAGSMGLRRTGPSQPSVKDPVHLARSTWNPSSSSKKSSCLLAFWTCPSQGCLSLSVVCLH